MHQTRGRDSSTGWIVPASAAASLLLMGVAGYVLYLHAGSILQKGQALSPLLILGLALIGGAASFFSPCSIAITPAFLAYLTVGTPPGMDARILSRPQIFAAGLVALGIVVFYSGAGIIIGMVGSIAYNYLIYFIPVVGAAFILLGALILLGRADVLAFVERWNPMNGFTHVRSSEHLLPGLPGNARLFLSVLPTAQRRIPARCQFFSAYCYCRWSPEIIRSPYFPSSHMVSPLRYWSW